MKADHDTYIIGLLVVGIVIAGITAVTIGGRFSSLGVGLTGRVVTNDNATVTLNVQTTSSLVFTDNAVAWGNVAVNSSKSGNTHCRLATLAGYASDTCENGAGGSVTYERSGLALENRGSTDLTVLLRSNVTAQQFLGGTDPVFEWNVTTPEAGACLNKSGVEWINSSSLVGAFESVTTTAKVICQNLSFLNTKDVLNISINISLPDNAPSGAKIARIEATAEYATS